MHCLPLSLNNRLTHGWDLVDVTLAVVVEEAKEKTADIVADVESGGKENIGNRLVTAW